MRKQRVYVRGTERAKEAKKQQNSFESTFDVSNRPARKQPETPRRTAIKISLRVPVLEDIKNESSPKEKENGPQLNVDAQLMQILRMSNQLQEKNLFNGFLKLNKQGIEKDEHSVLFEKLHRLFDLYIKEEILKHYCLKSGWRIEKKYLEKLVIPTFDLLAISKDQIPSMFEPFLKELTSKYILHTELDSYSRLSPECLLIEITEIWIRIKQAEIEAKRSLRVQLKYFKLHFCKLTDGAVQLDRTALYDKMFVDSRDIRMVNLIKIFIFCFKVQGEDNRGSFEDWMDQY